MDKLVFYKDELRQEPTKEMKKVEKEVNKKDLPIDPKMVFSKKPKNIPKKQYRKPNFGQNTSSY